MAYTIRCVFILLFAWLPMSGYSQNGYIKFLDSDSIHFGYLRLVSNAQEGHMLEFWKTKRDKTPQRISKSKLSEYAIKKDTFKVIQNFRPFMDEDLYYELAEAKIEPSKKINIVTVMYQPQAPGGIAPIPIITPIGAVVITVPLNKKGEKRLNYFFVLIDKNGFLRAIAEENFEEGLGDFFSPRFLKLYAEKYGPLQYKQIPDMVALYNNQTLTLIY